MAYEEVCPDMRCVAKKIFKTSSDIMTLLRPFALRGRGAMKDVNIIGEVKENYDAPSQ